MTNKRFTEAELVATLWFTRWVRATVMRFRKESGKESGGLPELDKERLAALRRFVALPHYDDPEYYEEALVEQDIAMSKRFREAELAADLWFMRWVRTTAFRFSTAGGPSELDNERLAALRRFATLPHYDDTKSYDEEEIAKWAEGMTEYNPTPEELDAILQHEYGSYGVELPEWYLKRFDPPEHNDNSAIPEETKGIAIMTEEKTFTLPVEAVEAAAKAIREADGAMFDGDDELEPKLTDLGATELANVALSAAMPILFAKMREQKAQLDTATAQLDAVKAQVEIWEAQEEMKGDDLAAHVSKGAFRIASVRIRAALRITTK